MGRLLRFRRKDARELSGPPTFEGPTEGALRYVTANIARQAHAEVLALHRGQRLIIERHTDDRAPFTIIVERMDVEA